MEVPQELAVGYDKLHVQDIEIGPLHGWNVMKHEDDARDCEKGEEEGAQDAQPQGERRSQSVGMDLRRHDVQEEVRDDGRHPVQFGLRQPVAEDRPPDADDERT